MASRNCPKKAADKQLNRFSQGEHLDRLVRTGANALEDHWSMLSKTVHSGGGVWPASIKLKCSAVSDLLL